MKYLVLCSCDHSLAHGERGCARAGCSCSNDHPAALDAAIEIARLHPWRGQVEGVARDEAV